MISHMSDTILETLEAISKVEKLITFEVRKGATYDKKKVRTLQNEHRGLSVTLANLHEDDGFTPKDEKDDGTQQFEQKQEDKRLKAEATFVAQQAEFANKEADSLRARRDLELKEAEERGKRMAEDKAKKEVEAVKEEAKNNKSKKN